MEEYKAGDFVEVVVLDAEDYGVFHMGGIYKVHHVDSSKCIWVDATDKDTHSMHFLFLKQVRPALRTGNGWETP